MEIILKRGEPIIQKIRFGVVGCGFFGGEFARILQSMEGVEVVAVYGGSGKSTRAIADEISCEIEEKLDGLVSRNDIDAVIVASPNHLHMEAVLAAAKHGKHVFCEKPVALNLEDAQGMVAACRLNHVQFMVGHILHFFRGIEQVKEWVRTGEIGRLLVCHTERTGWEKRKDTVSWKKKQNESGGHLFHHIHELDLIQSLMGPATAVIMMADNMAHHGSGCGDEDDVLLITLKFAEGGFGTMQYGSGFQWAEHYMKINGTEGAIKIDFRNSIIELRKDGLTKVTIGLHGDEAEDQERLQTYRMMDGGVIYGDPQLRPPAFLHTPMKREMQAFCDAIKGLPVEQDKRMLFDGSAAINSIKTASAAIRSRNLQ